jgi:hypothetical protein
MLDADHRVQPPSFEKEKTEKGMKYDRTTPVHPTTAMCFKLVMLPCYILLLWVSFFLKKNEPSEQFDCTNTVGAKKKKRVCTFVMCKSFYFVILIIFSVESAPTYLLPDNLDSSHVKRCRRMWCPAKSIQRSSLTLSKHIITLCFWAPLP